MDQEWAAWAPKRSEAEQRRMVCQLRYDLEMEFRKVGWGDPALIYDEEKDLFRFTDGPFAFSRDHADWELLRKRGQIMGLLANRCEVSNSHGSRPFYPKLFTKGGYAIMG